MTVNITNVADTFGNELKLCLYSVNPEVWAQPRDTSQVYFVVLLDYI